MNGSVETNINLKINDIQYRMKQTETKMKTGLTTEQKQKQSSIIPLILQKFISEIVYYHEYHLYIKMRSLRFPFQVCYDNCTLFY